MSQSVATAPEPRSPASGLRLDSLTGLRFVAALAVFGVHAAGQFWPGNSSVARATWQGVSGVSFFFILSGFVLAWSFRPGLPKRDFYRKRVARILPLYYLALLAAIAMHVRVGGLTWLTQALPSFGLVQSWLPRQTVYFGGNGPGWSLSCEAFFYALLPFVAGLLLRRSSRVLGWTVAACVAGSLLATAALHPHASDSSAYWALYVLPPTRLLEFVAGVAAGLVMKRGWRSPVPFGVSALIAVAVYAALGWAPRYLLPSAAMFVPYLLLITSAATTDLGRRPSLMRTRPMVRLGEWSFAFYLIHQMVIQVVLGPVNRLHLGSPGKVAGVVGALGLAVACSGVLYHRFEMPWESRLRPRPRSVTLPASPVRPSSVAAEPQPVGSPTSA